MLTFTTLLREIRATYPERTRRFHVLAVRYWLDVDSHADLRAHAEPAESGRDFFLPPLLAAEEIETIITNR